MDFLNSDIVTRARKFLNETYADGEALFAKITSPEGMRRGAKSLKQKARMKDIEYKIRFIKTAFRLRVEKMIRQTKPQYVNVKDSMFGIALSVSDDPEMCAKMGITVIEDFDDPRAIELYKKLEAQ